jgi:transposase InsO family protein
MATQRRQNRDDHAYTVPRTLPTSWAFSQNVRNAGLAPSMGAAGSPYDKALVS